MGGNTRAMVGSGESKMDNPPKSLMYEGKGQGKNDGTNQVRWRLRRKLR